MNKPDNHNLTAGTSHLNRAGVVTVAVLAVSLLYGCDSSPKDQGTDEPAVSIAEVVDRGVIDQGSMLQGRDGGYSGIVDGEVVWVFGDSVFNVADASGDTWLSNSWAVGNLVEQNNTSFSVRTATDSENRPDKLFSYTVDELSYNDDHRGTECRVPPCGDRFALWPGALVQDVERNRTLVFYSKVHASPGEFNFHGVGQSIAIWPDGELKPSRSIIDAESEWPTLLFQSAEPAFGVSALVQGDYLYTFSCEIDNLVKPCLLARVQLEKILQRDAWEFWSGDHWQSDFKAAVSLFNGNDIMSVHYDADLQQYIAVYSRPLGTIIELRTASEVTGPWSRPIAVTRALSSQTGNGWIYDALAHPELENGEPGILNVTYTRDTGTVREMRLVQIKLSSDITE